MEKYVNVEPLPPAVLYDEPPDGTQKPNDFGTIEDDEEEEEEEEDGEDEHEDDADSGENIQLQTLGKTESNASDERREASSSATSILGTVLSSTKSPFELLEGDDEED